MLSTNLIKNTLLASSISLVLTACGGGGGSSSKEPTTPPSAANVAPIIEDMSTHSVTERDIFAFSPSVSDSDGSVVEYKWEQIGYEYKLKDTEEPTPEEVSTAINIFQKYGLAVVA